MSDPRFSSLKTDPRFRRPQKHRSKVVLDDRFKDLLEDPKKRTHKDGAKRAARVDKYGRRVEETREQDDLRRFYRLESDEDEAAATTTVVDYARGVVLMESSDEDEQGAPSESGSASDSDDGGFVVLGAGSQDEEDEEEGEGEGEGEEEGEIDLDETTLATLDAQVAAYARAVPESASAPGVERTRRLAVVNLDWDHVRAVHLFKIASSLVSLAAPRVAVRTADGVHVARGKILSVRVYPSAFGKKRLAREEEEGPPTDVFKKKKKKKVDEEINEKTIFETGGEADYDEGALRKYQLERLRYYYAIVECDTVEAATHVYNELEGTELERSANVFDLSFVPDDMTFDNEPRDEATQSSDASYRAVEFVTDALRHSKVKLTWDEDDPERNHVLRRQLTKKEMDENDFRAYIASSSSSEGSDEEGETKKGRGREAKNEGNQSKKAERDRLRTLLLGGDDDMPEGWGNAFDNKESRAGVGNDSDVDMEITFAPGLSEVKNPEDENTLERYQRKKKEKKKKKEARKRAEADEEDGLPTEKKPGKSNVDDGFFGVESDSQPEEEEEHSPKRSKKKSSKPERLSETSKAELALLAASDNLHGGPAHFDMKAILKAEKESKKKSRHKSKKRDKDDADDGPGETQDDFVIDVKDDRFAAIHEDHQFAIDPTNPRFKKTKSMTALLSERSKRQKSGPRSDPRVRSPKTTQQEGRSLQTLVESVKRKSAVVGHSGIGKRRKLEELSA